MTVSEDIALIARVLGGDDRAAFGDLVRRHQSAVRAFLRALARGDHAWADDLAQETFVTAYRQLPRYRGESAFSTWLLGIAHNQFRNARRTRREPVAAEAAGETPSTEPPHTATVDLRHDLEQALRQLSPDEQTALHLCYRQGLSHTEAAGLLGWPVGTVKTHLLRGKERLRSLLAVWNPQS